MHLPSCLAAPDPSRKVSALSCLREGTGLPGTPVCISHILSLNSAGLSGTIYPRYQSLLYPRPRKDTTGVAPCPGRSHLCPSNCPLLLELVICCGCPRHLPSGSFPQGPASCLLLGLRDCLGCLGWMQSPRVPLKKMAIQPRKGGEMLNRGCGRDCCSWKPCPQPVTFAAAFCFHHRAWDLDLALQFSIQAAGGDNGGGGWGCRPLKVSSSFYNSRILRSALTLLALPESSGGLFTKGSGPASPLTEDKTKASI